MTLWRKESYKKDALYVDLFKNHDLKELTTMYDTTKVLKKHIRENSAKEKTSYTAIKGRIAGNAIFAQKKYYAAMKQYNFALCFAKHGSEEMALIYANRSACFYNLKMYEKCLIDIELAKKANYPESLMEKLNTRKVNADDLIAKGLSVAGYNPKLSYDVSEQIPVMANAVKIDIDEHRGRRVIATKDLSVGEIILSEPIYVGQSIGGEYTCCNICVKDAANLIPCKNCTRAMFCYGGCEQNAVHRLECDIREISMQTSLHETNCFHSIIRTILMAIELFPTIDDLIEFVEQNLPNESSLDIGIPQFIDDKAKYRTFLHLPAGKIFPITMQLVYCTYNTMLGNSEIAKIFNTVKYRRFLMHLILHHALALKNSALVLGRDIAAESTKKGENMAYYFGLTYRLFQHSCVPNTVLLFRNGSSFGVMIRPVKKGEELFISLIGTNSGSSYKERQNMLIDREIECECELCVQRLETLLKDTELKENMEYLTLYIRASRYVGENVTKEITKIGKADFEWFLQKYGRRPWGEEIQFLTQVYHYILMSTFTDRFQE